MAPQRILMTTDAVGGVWIFTSSLAASLAKMGFEIAVVTLGPRPSETQRQVLADHRGIKLIETDLQLEWQDPAGGDAERAFETLTAIARRFHPDVVHLNSYREASFAWDAPVLVVAHSCINSWASACNAHDAFASEAWANYSAAVSRGLRDADAWVAPTQAFRNAIAAIYQPPRQGRAIWNGVVSATSQPRSKQPFILGAGRMWDEAKNLAALANASTHLAWPTRIAGPIAFAANSADLPGGTCEFLGELPHDAVLQAMHDASIFASPAHYEPFGLTALEAARAGCALVLSDIPSFRELWDGAALFVDVNLSGALANALTTLIADTARRERLQRAAFARAARYSLQKTSAAYAALYTSMLDTSRRHVRTPSLEVVA